MTHPFFTLHAHHPRQPAGCLARHHTLPACTLAVSFAFVALSGCGALPAGGSGTGAATGSAPQGITADTPLIEVWVPGAIHTVYDHPDKRLNPLLNPQTPPPPFTEDAALARQCAPQSLSAQLDESLLTAADRAEFERTMRAGRATAQARHVWQFNQARVQAQLGVVAGPRSQRGTDPVQARPTGQPNAAPTPTRGAPRTAAPAPSTSRITAADIGGWLGLKPQPAPPTTATQLNAMLPNFDRMRQQLEVNQAVLAAQDSVMTGQSQQYAASLVGLYQRAFTRLAATSADRLPLARLNAFEIFRSFQVEQCIVARGQPDATTQALLQAQNERYAPLARAVIGHTRAQVLRDLNAATSTVAFQQTWAGHYGTPWLREQAEKDSELARAAAARATVLVAQEKRAREDAERRAAAEVVRQAALLKKKYLDNAARNLAPTADEVAYLATSYLMQNTAAGGKLGQLRRTSDGAFDSYRNNLFFGEQYESTNTIKVDDLTCHAKGPRQACKVRYTYQSYCMRYGRIRVDDQGTETLDVEFHWTGDGLQSAALQQGVGYINTVSVGGGGSSSASSERPGAARDEMNRNLDQFREDRRREAATTGQWYMGTSPRDLRREYGQ